MKKYGLQFLQFYVCKTVKINIQRRDDYERYELLQ